MKRFFNYLMVLFKKISDDEMLLRASGVSFYILLAFFPFVLIVFLLSTLISENVSMAIFKILNLLPEDIESIVAELLTNTQASGFLIVALVCISIWTLASALVTISQSFNVFYGVKETRNFLLNRLSAIVWAVLMLLLIIIVMVLIVFENHVTALIQYYFKVDLNGPIFEIAGLLLLFLLVTFMLALIYKYVPNKKMSFRSVLKGSVTATVLWGLSSYGFSLYVNNFATYHVLYGSIAGIIILVTWIFITSSVLLLGGEINSINANKNEII